MSLDAERRAKFVQWFSHRYAKVEERDRRKRFMEESGRTGEKALTPGRVSQMFDPKKPFNEQTALNLAARFGLADDYFLRPSGVSGDDPFGLLAELLDDLASLPAERRAAGIMAAGNGLANFIAGTDVKPATGEAGGEPPSPPLPPARGKRPKTARAPKH